MGTRGAGEYLHEDTTDHPHACGDKIRLLSPAFLSLGSSPRVWGQESQSVLTSYSSGIIPTRVGTSETVFKDDRAFKDHPHACGDKRQCKDVKGIREGSSPRVWGQADGKYSACRSHRIIPTRVGTRLKKSRKIAVLQNQPLRFPLTFHRSFV